MRPWAAPRPSRCRPCPTMRRDAARPTATETSSPVSTHTHTHTHTHTKMSIKASQLHFTPLIAQRRPIAPSALTIYSLHYSSQSSGSVLSSPFQTITVNAAVLLESCMLTVHERVRK